MSRKTIKNIFTFSYGGKNTNVGTVTDVSATLPLVSSGGATPNISFGAKLDGNYALNFLGGVPTFVPIQGETVGAYKAFSTTAIPSNFLFCNGATVLIATYPDLFAVIGNTFGGDGITNFTLPDLQDRLLKGDNGANIGTSAGNNVLTVPQLPTHNHQLIVEDNTSNTGTPNGNYLAGDSGGGGYNNTLSNPAILGIETVGLKGGNQPHEHPHLVVRWAICFESLGINGVASTSSLPQVLAVNGEYIVLTETSTIADFVAGQTHYYVGKTPITFDYDTLPQPPNPNPVSGFNFVNQSVFDVTFISGTGNSSYLLTPNQSLTDIQITDIGGGYWDIIAAQWNDNIYNLDTVTGKGAVTTNAIIIRNNPDTYRTRYSITGQQIQRDDLGYALNYVEIGITKTATGSKSWQLQMPDLTGNANSSSFSVAFRPNVSGTVAYLEDISNILTSNEFIVTSTTPYVATDNIKNIYVNPISILLTANITLHANPTNGQKVMLAIGGAITSGSVVTTLTVLGTIGNDILSGDLSNPTSLVIPVNSGDTYTFQYSSQLSKWLIN